MRNLQEQVKKAFCYQKLFWPFIFWIFCSSDLKNFANSWPSTSHFKNFSLSLEQFFLIVDQNNFGNKIPLFHIATFFITFFRVQLAVQHNQLFPDLIKQEETLLIKQAMHYLLKKLDWNLRYFFFSILFMMWIKTM